mmetsp:Transcript_14553/g.57160  ORF Transcript_14553/g.57160 Transcript_14553/m.57160 type:complete len:359 (+) Transcript_14553:298-1374(+)
MGNLCGGGNPYKGSKEEQDINNRIEKQLRQQRKELETEIKMLLLGAGESGKSTIAKQMKIIFMDGFSKQELMNYRSVIYNNVILGMRTMLIEGEDKLGITVKEEVQQHARLLTETNFDVDHQLTPDLAEAIATLWKQVDVKKIFSQRNQFQLPDSVAYFCENVMRIAAPDYTPTLDDVLQSRARTVGIKEIGFSFKGYKWRIVDVGGQRTERRKWIHCFEDATSIIFCTDSAAYNLKLFEDDRVNRMEEAFTLFHEICNCRYFECTPIILFLNKSDLLKEKVKRYNIKDYFPSFTGEEKDFEAAVTWLKAKYNELNEVPNKSLYQHVTCATNTDNIKFVWNAVQEIMMYEMLRETNLM